jgi:hypothetical protein
MMINMQKRRYAYTLMYILYTSLIFFFILLPFIIMFSLIINIIDYLNMNIIKKIY